MGAMTPGRPDGQVADRNSPTERTTSSPHCFGGGGGIISKFGMSVAVTSHAGLLLM